MFYSSCSRRGAKCESRVHPPLKEMRNIHSHHHCCYRHPAMSNSSSSSHTLCENKRTRPVGGPTEKHQNPLPVNPKEIKNHPAYRSHACSNAGTKLEKPAIDKQAVPRQQRQHDVHSCLPHTIPHGDMRHGHHRSYEYMSTNRSCGSSIHQKANKLNDEAEPPKQNHGHSRCPTVSSEQMHAHSHNPSRRHSNDNWNNDDVGCSLHASPHCKLKATVSMEKKQEGAKWVYGPPLPVFIMAHRGTHMC